MKFVQQMLMASVAIGIAFPLEVFSDEISLEGVDGYSASTRKVRSINDFSDVQPSDWAYRAIDNLIKRYGCVAGYSDGTFRGNRAMTRYEVAALLDACLEKVTEVSDNLPALVNEFAPELSVIQGRIDGLEARIGEFEATRFSTTTKFRGETVYVVGGVDYEDRSKAGKIDDSLSFNYSTRLDLDTSFTGKDLLRTRISSGNFLDTPWSESALLERNYSSNNVLKIDRNFYQFPIVDGVIATLGSVVRKDDMLAVWPSDYPRSSVLDVLTYAGAPAAYNRNIGTGLGFSYAKDSFSASIAYLGIDADNAEKGIATEKASDDITAQVAYSDESFGAAIVYTNSDQFTGDYDAWGVSTYWIPSQKGFLPSLSGGVGFKNLAQETSISKDEFTWLIGVQWSDIWLVGNTLGLGLGSSEGWQDKIGYNDPISYELWYEMVVSDQISITPSLFFIEKDGDDKNLSGGLVKTKFSF